MSEEVTFKVVKFPPFDSERGNRLLLVKDNWDDFGYKTTFGLYRLFPEKEPLNIGVVKIAQRSKYGGDSDAEDHRTELPTTFAELSEDYFSLGQGPEFYENLVNFGQNFAHGVLAALRDIAFDPNNLGEDLNSDVTTKSLLRTVNFQNVENQYRRIIFGGDKLEGFSFTYTFPEENGTLSESPVIAFEVEPKSLPPSNVHAVIGSNGCGKTWLLESLSMLLLDENTRDRGKISSGNSVLNYPGFASLIAVSFSAFDRFSVSQRESEPNRIPFRYVGLRAKGHRWQLQAENSPTSKGLEELTDEFSEVFLEVMQDHLKEEWRKAIGVLNNTLSFDGDLWLELSKDDRGSGDQNYDVELAKKHFYELSSGHKIVLLVLTQLIAKVGEKSLVLIDEPETHLHPPLLSSFVRILSDLMREKNGVAIITTHSPVVLQEVPKKCVTKLSRSGNKVRTDRPQIETFGASVSSLTSEVFGLEVTRTGYHKYLREALSESNGSFAAASARFNDELGNEARVILRTLADSE